MAAERVIAAETGLKSPDHISHSLSPFIGGSLAKTLANHERDHGNVDKEGSGEYAYILTTGRVVAMYIIHGPRTPEQLMEIAKAPGFSEMSKQDWDIHNRAWRDYIQQIKDQELEEVRNEDGELIGLGVPIVEGEENGKEDSVKHDKIQQLVDIFTKKLDDMQKKGELPDINSVMDRDISELLITNGKEILDAYKKAHDLVYEKVGEEDGEVEKENIRHEDVYIAPKNYDKLPKVV